MKIRDRKKTAVQPQIEQEKKSRAFKGFGSAFSWKDLIKWAFALLIAIILISKLAENRQSKADFKDVQKAVTATVKSDQTMLEGDQNMIKRLYGLDPSQYEGISLRYPSTNMNVNEVFLVKLKSPDQQEQVKEAIESRLATQLNNFDGYGTDQYSILEKSVTDVKGNYILFVVSKKTDPIVKAFEKAIR